MKSTLKKVLGTAALLSLASIQSVHADIQARIIGGSAVSIDSYPSTVALLSERLLASTGSAFQAQFCGGTLIQSNWVITAAHCVVQDGAILNTSDFSVLAGSTDLENPLYQPNSVARIIVHEGYTSALFSNDIALLELTHPAPAPAIALSDTQAITGDEAHIVGWGMIRYSSNPSEVRFPTQLQAAKTQTITGFDCAQFGGIYVNVDSATQVCAGFRNGGIDTCKADSGGPIYSVTKQNTLRLAGITSWGDECAQPNKPGVYTNVLSYTAWIQQNLAGTQQISTVPPQFDSPSQNPIQTAANEIGRESLAGTGSSGLAFLPIICTLLCLRRRTRSADLLK